MKLEGMFKHGEVSIVAGVGDRNYTNKEVTGGKDGGKVGVLETLREEGIALALKEGT